jgi:hypothetical protein
MPILRYLYERFFRTKSKEPLDLNKSQGILIRPDGSWIVAPHNTPQVQHHPYAPQNPYGAGLPPVLGKDLNWLSQDSNRLDVLNFPPTYFPHAQELYSKLEQCLDRDIITSCVHKQTQNNIYILAIELPCGPDHCENMRRFKQFIKAMEEMYDFKVIQQERINSSVCNEQSYSVVFEYDPKMTY